MKAISTKKYTEKSTYSPSELIEKKDLLVKEIRDYWNILARENVIEKRTKQKFDLQKVYTEINKKQNDLIEVKLAIQAINMGLFKMSEMSEKNLYTQIYLMQQLKEHKVKLGMIPTKRKENQTVVLTDNFIKREINQIGLGIQEIQESIDNFNKKTTFKIDE